MLEKLKAWIARQGHASAPTRSSIVINPATAAAWLIPSVSVLFGAIGYVILSAHENLLGIDLGSKGSAEYVGAAARFLQDLGSMLFVAVPSGDLGVWDVPEIVLASFCAILCALIFLRPDVQSKTQTCGVWLIVIVSLKFVIIDAPLMRVENVVGRKTDVESNFYGQHTTTDVSSDMRAQVQRSGVMNKLIAQRALNTYTAIVCARRAIPEIGCGDTNAASYEKIVHGKFVSNTLISMLLLAAAIRILRFSNIAWVSVAALFLLAYSLSWPYAYGKLKRSTDYLFGLVSFNAPAGNTGDVKGPTRNYGVLVYQTDHLAKLLVREEIPCSPTVKSSEVKLWAIPNSEIKKITEIHFVDVIRWKIDSEKTCPYAPIGPS